MAKASDSTTPKASDSDTPKAEKAKASSEPTPLSPAGLQPGESVSSPLTTRVPRGVDEPPSDLLADEPAARALQEHVKEVVDREQAQGYRGDPDKNRTPNSAYTLQGVGRGDPTPETTVYTPTTGR